MTNENVNVKDNKQAQNGVSGKLSFDDKVVQKIIGISLERVDGLLTVDGGFFSNMTEKLVNTDNVTSGISTEVGEKQVAADMQIVVEYGKDARVIYSQMKEIVSEQIKKMTGLDLVEFNVEVVDIQTKAEYEANSKSVQDKIQESRKSDDDSKKQQSQQASNTSATRVN
ncbi:putative alkaline shock family protein YloU [Weissella uvarum]|uniref:Asp23/Gls24 family envelope stress response protein n=1 Tax=Weissella uvarum TaxID=1479233 RepID=UPI001961741C|nr:Asp23/Gls24 family envelope stress response protein [Weissella uvarum]MBM7617007.1 putative alkaline shock family protein YloU [Weissella uvarum]MCM0595305.1 Asp23/Gls24 family envelope stress response protein [Weissella uvarum]